MMISSDRHAPHHFTETMKGSCSYCRRMPPKWYHVGREKVCVYCGTRVYSRVAAQPRDDAADTPDSER